jgi:SAM-dependent methyltransferase
MAWRNIDLDHSTTSDLAAHAQDVADVRDVRSRTDGTSAPANPNKNGPSARTGPSPATKPAAVSQPARLSNASSVPEQIARLAAQQVSDLLREIDRRCRHVGTTVPTGEEREMVASSFWWAIRQFTMLDERVGDVERACCAAAVREVLHPWLLRSDYWSRSYLKPHGYAGDFRLLEWMYDLELDRCCDPTRPAVVNLLDYLYSTVHSVRAVWHRRRWYAYRIQKLKATAPRDRPLRILDLACGGSRYLRDCVRNVDAAGAVELTLLDQDPAALAFVDGWLPDSLRPATRLICGPVRDALSLVDQYAPGRRGRFDLVISTGLFDYLDDAAARRLLTTMCQLARPGGSIALCNFAPQDPSRIVKDWVVDWPLVYRDCSALRALVPDTYPVCFDRSPDGGLVYALIEAPNTTEAGRSAEEDHHVAH